MTSFLFFFLIQSFAATSPFFSDLNNFKDRNLNLQTEKQNLKSSSDVLLSKKLFWTPTISVSANESQTKNNSQLTADSNYLQADVALNVFRGGSDINALYAASAQKKAQELQVLNESLRVEIKASDLIFKSLYLIESVRIQEQFLKLKEESLKIVRDRYGQGKLPLQEVTKSEVDLTQQKNKLRSSILDLVENKSQIASLFVSEIQTKEWPFDESTLSNASNAMKLPVVEQRYWTSQAGEELWKATKGNHWPSVDLHLQYQEADIQYRKNNQLVGLVSLTLPLWNRFETSAQVSTAYAQYNSALNDFKDTEQILKQRQLFLQEKTKITRLNLTESKKNLQSARKLYQDVLKSFRTGRISTNDLIIEQNRLLENETTLSLNQLNYHQSLIETCSLSGLTSADCLH